jgi:hypothetical protein
LIKVVPRLKRFFATAFDDAEPKPEQKQELEADR